MQQQKWDLFRDSFLILCIPRLYWDRWPTGHRIHRGLRLIEHFERVEFGKMVEQVLEVVSDPTSCHLWWILLRYDAQMFG